MSHRHVLIALVGTHLTRFGELPYPISSFRKELARPTRTSGIGPVVAIAYGVRRLFATMGWIAPIDVPRKNGFVTRHGPWTGKRLLTLPI